MPATVASSVVISSGTTTSGSYDISNVAQYPLGGFVGFVMPAAFTGASISFNVSVDDSTYQQLYDSSNTLVSITVTAAKTYGFKQDIRSLLSSWRFIQIVSASSEGADRTIVILLK